MVRSFIAVEAVNHELQEAIKALQSHLASLPSRINMVNPNITHITLKFLGETPEGKLKEISNRLDRIHHKRFMFTIKGVGVFPKKRRPRIVHLEVGNGSKELVELAEKVEEAMTQLGFPREKRHFVPHITIARIKEPWKVIDLPEEIKSFKADIEVYVSELKLKKSNLTPRGPIYEDIYVKHLDE